MEGQLRKLRNGTHPKTGEPLPPAIELGPATLPIKVRTNEVEHKPPDGFYIYEPLARPPAIAVVPAEVQSCSDRQAARLDRIRAKELANSLRHVVISDDVPHCTTEDGKGIILMPNDAVTSGLAFPLRVMVAVEFGSTFPLMSNSEFLERPALKRSRIAVVARVPVSCTRGGGVHLQLAGHLVPPSSLRLIAVAVRPHRRDGPASMMMLIPWITTTAWMKASRRLGALRGGKSARGSTAYW